MKNKGFLQRLRFKYRVSVLNENTLNEAWHTHLSRRSLFFWVLFLFLLSFALFAALIWFTPIKNYLPGYNEDIRHELIVQMERVDSLNRQLQLQTAYLATIRAVVAGEVVSDSVKPLDSLVIQKRELLLEDQSPVMLDFLSQYEQKERDNLTTFLSPSSATRKVVLFPPIHGTVCQPFNRQQKQYAVALNTQKNENIMAVLSGTVICCTYTIDHEWVMILQHDADYVSIYKDIQQVLKKQGDFVQPGETIALITDGQHPFTFELWQNGTPIDPEEVIAF